jgi:hypothetical protein
MRCRLWRTLVSGLTNDDGFYRARGYRGLYEVAVEVEGKKTVLPFNTEHGTGMIRVVLP